MRDIFNLDGPFIAFLNKAADLVLLNFLYIICCIPVVTIGAATTALYYVTLRMAKNEEGYITKDFFRSFKENFRQATVIWLILLCLGIVFGGEFFIINRMEGTVAFVIECILCLGILLFAFEMLYAFPVLSRFENTIKNTMKNALFISILQIPKTLAMLVFSIIPIVMVLASLRWLPLVAALGFSVAGYTNACWMNKIFKKFEPEEPEEEKAL
ncbi:MAG: YesL family protein [Roseburia sp.]|nr:YesL family protein [Roseburia sp.]MCM1277532.1 YesL family protein [Robinsoniella sp.]